MADRKTLHFSKLEEFKKWLVKNDWEIKPLSRSDYEVLRAKKDSDWVIVYKKDSATEHYSLTDHSIWVVNQWLRECKMRKKICDEIRNAIKDCWVIKEYNCEYGTLLSGRFDENKFYNLLNEIEQAKEGF